VLKAQDPLIAALLLLLHVTNISKAVLKVKFKNSGGSQTDGQTDSWVNSAFFHSHT
jgi:hypothetical protein